MSESFSLLSREFDDHLTKKTILFRNYNKMSILTPPIFIKSIPINEYTPYYSQITVFYKTE